SVGVNIKTLATVSQVKRDPNAVQAGSRVQVDEAKNKAAVPIPKEENDDGHGSSKYDNDDINNSEDCDECENKSTWVKHCDSSCQNDGKSFINYVQDGIGYEFGLIKRYGPGISSDECNKHINKIQNYIWQINQQTGTLGSVWFQGNGAQYHGQVDGVVGLINQIIQYFSNANIDRLWERPAAIVQRNGFLDSEVQ
ncbi:hypothetical protein MPER_03495, partial [Moniliophthora perniciosa FA553]